MPIERVDPADFDWSSPEGPAADVRRIADASNVHDGVVTLNEQAVLQLKNRGLRDASLWLATGDGGQPRRRVRPAPRRPRRPRRAPRSEAAGHRHGAGRGGRRRGPQGGGVVARRPPGRRPARREDGCGPRARAADHAEVARRAAGRGAGARRRPDQDVRAGRRGGVARGQRDRVRPPPRAGAHDPRGLHRAHPGAVVRPGRAVPRRARRRRRPPAAGLPLDQGAPRGGPGVRRGLRRRGQPQGRRPGARARCSPTSAWPTCATSDWARCCSTSTATTTPRSRCTPTRGSCCERTEVQYVGTPTRP